MNKTDLIALVSEKTGQSRAVVGGVIDAAFEAIGDAVATGQQAAFIGFGTFSTVERPARTGRNPKTGEPLQIAASIAPKFTPGSVLKAKVKHGESA